jgi:hypothetical protein
VKAPRGVCQILNSLPRPRSVSSLQAVRIPILISAVRKEALSFPSIPLSIRNNIMNPATVWAFAILALSLVPVLAQTSAPPSQSSVQFVSLPGFEPPKLESALPTQVILPDDVVTSSILFWRFPGESKPYAVKFEYTEKGALKAQAFTQAHRGERVRIQIGKFSLEGGNGSINTSGRDGIHGLSWRDMENIRTYLQPGRPEIPATIESAFPRRFPWRWNL